MGILHDILYNHRVLRAAQHQHQVARGLDQLIVWLKSRFGRSETSLVLGTTIIACVFWHKTCLLCLMFTTGIVYDVYYIWHHHQMSWYVTLMVALIGFGWTYMMWHAYHWNPYNMIAVGFVTQVSDIYQYLAGTRIGGPRIGWISPRKTWSGYVMGLLAIMITFAFVWPWHHVVMIYVLGCLSGLMSSLLKRNIGIKDYSDLLGHHGGWLDRVDSVILPSIVYYLADVDISS